MLMKWQIFLVRLIECEEAVKLNKFRHFYQLILILLIDNIKVGQAAEKWQAGQPKSQFKVNRNQYLKMIDGIVYGEDPRQGYVADNKFFHPELLFEFPIPNDWKTMNSPQQFQMAPDDGKAIMVLRLAQGQDLELAAE